jgi:hypothetical protein
MKRGFLWLQFVAASLVVVGVILTAFSITAFVRGAGSSAHDMHEQVGAVTHWIEFFVFLAALVAWWKQWREIALAFSLPFIGTIQFVFLGDMDKPGGWVNGLHGVLALVVFVLAAVIAQRDMKALGLVKSTATT